LAADRQAPREHLFQRFDPRNGGGMEATPDLYEIGRARQCESLFKIGSTRRMP
jgi:hypothetical protein